MYALMFSAVQSMMRWRLSFAAHEMCGVMMQFFAVSRGCRFGWLRRHDVHAGGIDFAAVQRIRQIPLVDERAASVVDDDYPVFHLCDAAAVDYLFRIGQQRAVERYHVGTSEKFVKLYVPGDFTPFFGRTAVVGDNVHSHALAILPVCRPILPKPMIPMVLPASSIIG